MMRLLAAEEAAIQKRFEAVDELVIELWRNNGVSSVAAVATHYLNVRYGCHPRVTERQIYGIQHRLRGRIP